MERSAALAEGGGYYRWHAGAPSDEDFERARDELVDEHRGGTRDARPRPARARRRGGVSQTPTATRSRASPRAVPERRYRRRPTNTSSRPTGTRSSSSAETNDRLVVLDADLASDCRVRGFELAFPDRFVECGIAEQDMVSTAAGLARHGFLPVVNSFASFLASRANEQIYNQASEGSKVVYALHYAGLIPAGPGKSHQSVRDVSLLGALPNMTIVQPGNSEETRALLRWAVEEAEENVAVRLAIGPSPRDIELPAGYEPTVGWGAVLRDGEDAVLLAYGPVLLHEALLAAERLSAEGVDLRVVNMPWLNRVDPDWASVEIAPAPARLRSRGSRSRRRARGCDAPGARRSRGHGLRRGGLAGVRNPGGGASASTSSTAPRSPGASRHSSAFAHEANLARPSRPALDPHVLRRRDRRPAPRAARRKADRSFPRLARRGGRVEQRDSLTLRCSSATSSPAKRGTACWAGSMPGSTGASATTRSRSGSTIGTASTSSGWSPATRTGCSTPTAKVRCRAGASSSERCNAGTSAPAGMCRDHFSSAMQRECSALVVSNVQPRNAVPFLDRCPTSGAARDRPCGELGSHGRERGHLALLRPVHRPEPGHGGRPAPLSRHRSRACPSDRLAADRHLPARATARRLRGALARLRPRRRAVRSCSSWGTRRRTRHTKDASSSASSPGGRSARASAYSCCSDPIRATGIGASGSASRSAGRASSCRSRATRTWRSSRPSFSTGTSSSAMRGRSCSTRSSTTGRSCASSTTKARPPASRGRRRT